MSKASDITIGHICHAARGATQPPGRYRNARSFDLRAC